MKCKVTIAASQTGCKLCFDCKPGCINFVGDGGDSNFKYLTQSTALQLSFQTLTAFRAYYHVFKIVINLAVSTL